MKVLQPILHRDWYTQILYREIENWFAQAMFDPMLSLLGEENIKPNPKDQRKQNATRSGSALRRALQDGKIYYSDNTFTGTFSAAVSREIRGLGGTFNPKTKTFALPEWKIPMDFRDAVFQSQQRSHGIHQSVIDFLNEAEKNVPLVTPAIEVTQIVDRIISDLQKQFIKTVSAVKVSAETGVSAVEVEAVVTPAMRDQITREVTQNIDLSIKNFSLQQIPKLRKRVEENLFAGYRTDRLAKIIEVEFGVSKRKAEFLADQETGLLAAAYRQARYNEVGVTTYIWSTSHDERVRPDHRALNGKKFSYDQPPVTNRSTGAKNNPGQDFRCLPGDSPVKIANSVGKCFRRWYRGELTTIILESGKTIRATPNHPVLTVAGWKPIGLLDKSDQIIELVDDFFSSAKSNVNKGVTTIAELFESNRKAGLSFTFQGKEGDFHGDGSNGYVDVVNAAGALGVNGQAASHQGIAKFLFAVTTFFATSLSEFFIHPLLFALGHLSPALVGGHGKRLSFFDSHPTHSNDVGFGTTSNGYSCVNQPATNDISADSESICDGQFTIAGDVCVDDRFWINLNSAGRFVTGKIKSISSNWFSGHVYNLETDCGYYATANVVVSNCRCVPLPILGNEFN